MIAVYPHRMKKSSPGEIDGKGCQNLNVTPFFNLSTE